METRYDIQFDGQILPGQDPAEVQARIGRLFKASDATLKALFSGKLQTVKRGCDKATALKYKQAMEQAGAKPLIKRADTAPAAQPVAATNPAPPAAEPTTPAATSAADRIAALAAEPDKGFDPGGKPLAPVEYARPDTPAAEDNESLSVRPVGELLDEAERPTVVPVAVDISGLDVAPPGPLPQPAPSSAQAPDTTHLSMAAAGEAIPTLPGPAPVQVPDSGIALSPEGTDFSDCAGPEPIPPALDLDALNLAPSGADLLEAQYRKTDTAAAPDTGHLSLKP